LCLDLVWGGSKVQSKGLMEKGGFLWMDEDAVVLVQDRWGEVSWGKEMVIAVQHASHVLEEERWGWIGLADFLGSYRPRSESIFSSEDQSHPPMSSNHAPLKLGWSCPISNIPPTKHTCSYFTCFEVHLNMQLLWFDKFHLLIHRFGQCDVLVLFPHGVTITVPVILFLLHFPCYGTSIWMLPITPLLPLRYAAIFKQHFTNLLNHSFSMSFC
jgi:hypothetical protein